ncbi:hypothetical protein RM543_01310 [Roseicyclus sp. F158]|uniref:Aspartate carbamoyltransferase catalytic subunit n=1 Tax=Tropicimonas omnivorans TaxID=3075590 RepID=A0ABU3DC69_9RHOB|nr:hypothetical protein [Roseicyclus sp. F158]MDT0681305.1 hypothetical protein [Roseicyclus sp. F158]
MSGRVDVPAGETGVIRVFAVDAAAGTPFSAQEAEAALGGDTLDKGKLEVVNLEDLLGVGLTGYLIEGLGADPDEVAPDRQKLDNLSGQAVIVPSSAFEGRAVTLEPRAPLTEIGAYREIEATPATGPLESQAAAGSMDRPGRGSRAPRLATPLAALILVLVALGVLIWLLAS